MTIEFKLPSDYVELGWTQKHYAKNKNDEPVGPTSAGAIKWCLFGAIIKATHENNELFCKFRDLLYYKFRQTIYANSTYWNDVSERTKQEVVSFLRECEIELGLRECCQ